MRSKPFSEIIERGREKEMEAEKKLKSSESYPMNGGDGLYSYSKNSSYQGGVVVSGMVLINESIANMFDIENLSSSTFKIADLGCSVGPNTFLAVQNIIEAIKLKYQSQGLSSHVPEFQVFFNDLASNDFNTLFRSLPPDRQYFAMGVPGSFYGRLFPQASLHLVYSSYAIHWLSKVPEEVKERSSPAWNKGRIHYSNAGDEVRQAYTAQYVKDMECFLQARAQEVVCGGFVVLTLPARPNDTPHSQAVTNLSIDLLGTCLMDLAKKEKVSEEKVDSFNVPTYGASPQELEAVVVQNGCFSIERMERMPRTVTPMNSADLKGQVLSKLLRAAMEGIIKEHFGAEILDELFDLFRKKVEAIPKFGAAQEFNLFVLLKRKVT